MNIQVSETDSNSLNRYKLPPVLRRAWYGLNQAFRRRIAHLEMTPDQYTVLRTLIEGNQNALTQKELTHQMSSGPNTIASLLDRMETNGFISRQVDATDRRARRIYVEKPGEDRFNIARDIAIELQKQIMAPIPEQRREAFMRDLVAVAGACKDAAECSPRKSRHRHA